MKGRIRDICAVVAVDANWGIGYKNELLFYIPEDMKWFRNITLNNTVIMGNNTYKSLPKKPLQDRNNIIITRNTDNIVDNEHIDIYQHNVLIKDTETTESFLTLQQAHFLLKRIKYIEDTVDSFSYLFPDEKIEYLRHIAIRSLNTMDSCFNDVHLGEKWYKENVCTNVYSGEVNDIIVIGGSFIYNELLQYCDKVYVTKVFKTADNVDSFFTNLDELNEWKIECKGIVKEYNGIEYQLLVYNRKKY